MEGIPAPDVADYKRRKEIELGLAAGSISQPQAKRPKIESRVIPEEELRRQLEEHKALMGLNNPEPVPAQESISAPAVYGAPQTYAAPPLPMAQGMPTGPPVPPPFPPGPPAGMPGMPPPFPNAFPTGMPAGYVSLRKLIHLSDLFFQIVLRLDFLCPCPLLYHLESFHSHRVSLEDPHFPLVSHHHQQTCHPRIRSWVAHICRRRRCLRPYLFLPRVLTVPRLHLLKQTPNRDGQICRAVKSKDNQC